MKRFLSFVLAIVLVIGSFTITCKATQVNEYSNSSYDVDGYYETVYTLYDGFMTGFCWGGYLADKKNFVYPQVKDELADNGFFQACLSSAEFLTNAGWSNLFKGEYDANDVKVQYYVTALCSLLMTMEDNWEDIRASQSKADATMTWNEYVAEGASAIAGCLAEENIPETLKTALTVCGISISVIGDSIETVDDFATLEAYASTFLMYRSLLETLISNTSDTLLTQAAEYLLKATDLCCAYRMNHFDTAINSESDYFFFVLDEVIKEGTEDGSLLSGEWTAMGLLNGAAKFGGSFKLGVDSGKFLMDLGIHSSDTMLRYYEMCAMASVRDALISEITKRNSKISGQRDWEQILNVRDLLVDLLYVNVRGEYCVYSLLKDDAGLLSVIHSMVNGKKDEKWYNTVLNIANDLQKNIEGFFPEWENFKRNIDYENLVTDAYSYVNLYSDGYNNINVSYRIPKINLSSETIQKINSEIYDTLYYGTVKEEFANMSIGVSVVECEITYDWAVNGDILSLWITCKNYAGWTDYFIYNINVNSSEVVSNNDLIKSHDMSLDDYREQVRKALYSFNYEGLAMWVEQNPNSKDTISFANEILTNDISPENLALSKPFLNKNGELCIVGFVYSIAGADGYYHIINLENFEAAEEYPSLFAIPPEQQDLLSETEAKRIAEEKSGFHDGELEDDEYVIQFWYVGQDIYNERRTYVYQIRRLIQIEGPQFTMLIETVYIDTETGECYLEAPAGDLYSR